jgi:hypothetical protein
MEVSVSRPIVVQRSREEIISILEECSKSKLKVKEFVKTVGIQEGTYYYWRNKYGGKACKERSGFTTIKMDAAAPIQAATLFAEVRGIKIYHYVPSSYLKDLI